MLPNKHTALQWNCRKLRKITFTTKFLKWIKKCLSKCLVDRQGDLHVSTVDIMEEKTMKRSPKNKLPALLNTFEASLPASWYIAPIRSPTSTVDANLKWVNICGRKFQRKVKYMSKFNMFNKTYTKPKYMKVIVKFLMILPYHEIRKERIFWVK